MTSNRRATAMVMALVALVVTSAISVEIVRTASLYQAADRDLHRRRQAQLLAQGAVERALVALAASPAYEGETWVPELFPDEEKRSPGYSSFKAEIVIQTSEDVPPGQTGHRRIRVTAVVGENETHRAMYQLEIPVEREEP